ncbi:MAG: trypsin-like peptidase domain-containing protein [Chloroflexi bacterium]|nr:trypsin-like peptidase domain-containing protein [Chloroflexota bacterium]
MEAQIPSTPPLSQIVRDAEPSLVCIRTPSSSGSGFVVDLSGNVITNSHVVGSHTEVTLEFVNGETHNGLVIGVHPSLDLACIRLSENLTLKPLPLGDSGSAQVGEDVVAIGYPMSDFLKGSPTVTRGIISAKRVDSLQTDAAINPGNSGGPLLDSHGNAIGVNTSVLAPVAGQSIGGIGFAIPIDDVKEALDLLASGTHPTSPKVHHLEASKQGASVLHHIGNGGFSIAMPQAWTPNQFNQQGTLFFLDDNYFSVNVIKVDNAFSLQDFADDMYRWWHEEAGSWTDGSATWHGRSRGSSRNNFSLSLRGDRGDGSGMRTGRVEWSLFSSPTNSRHLISADLNVAHDYVGAGRTRSKRGEGARELSRTIASFLDTVSIWDTYWSDHYYWSISAAPGWHSTHCDDLGLILNSTEQDAYLTVDIVDVADHVTAEELCKDAVAEHLTKEDAWQQWDVLSSHEDDYEGHNWYRINFRYKPHGYQPAVICIIQVGRSGSLEYVVTARTNEHRISEHAVAIDHMLESFRF